MQGRMNGLMWMDITVVWMNAYVCVDECVYVYTHPSIHPPTQPSIHPSRRNHIYIYTHTHITLRAYLHTPYSSVTIWSGVWRFPARPPAWYGLVGVGGAGVCGNGRGPLELPLDGGVVLGGRPGLTRKPFASRIPYNVARAPVLINLNLYFKPYTQP